MGILFLVALVLALPTFGLSLVAFFVLRLVRGYLQAKAQMEGKQRRADFRTLMEPLFQGRIEEFFLTLDIPRWAWADGDFTKEEARDCMKHILFFFSDNPDEAAHFMRALEHHRVKSRAAGLDPISAALYERNQNLKGEIHRLVYRAIATIKTANPSLRCFGKVDVAELGLRIVALSTSPLGAGNPVTASQSGEELLQARWIALLKRIGRVEATKLLSLTQALDAALIQRHESNWDWKGLSGNEVLPWSFELIERHKDRWDWNGLSESDAMPWSLELIERFEDRWDWDKLSANKTLPWSLELIERFEGRWDWDRLSANKTLPWSLALIELYKARWDWDRLSANETLPWCPELIERYDNPYSLDRGGHFFENQVPRDVIGCDQWDWRELSANEGLPWSLDLIERYKDGWNAEGLSENEALPWSLELIERYKNRWDWQSLAANEALPWSLELIERYEERWRRRLPGYRDWSPELIERWTAQWDPGLCTNKALPWSPELIERYKDRWNWAQLSRNVALPWSLELIERYEDRWHWGGGNIGGGLSQNEDLPWSLELIERYEERWDWRRTIGGCLSGNKGLPWSLELIERFEDRWDWDRARDVLRRTKVLVLSSSAMDGLMAHFAYPDEKKAESLLNKRQRGDYMTSSTITVIEYSGGDLYVVMHKGKQVEIAVDHGPPRMDGGPQPEPVIREFLASRADQHISTHPIYECSIEDRKRILAVCDDAVTRYLSSLSDEP